MEDNNYGFELDAQAVIPGVVCIYELEREKKKEKHNAGERNKELVHLASLIFQNFPYLSA